MTRTFWLAIALILGGIVALLFQSIQSMMTEGEIVWEAMTLVSLFGEERFAAIERISWLPLHNLAKMVVNAEFYLVLIGAGILVFIIGMVTKRV